MIDEHKGQETKICNKCGRELPIERFELMKQTATNHID